MTHLNFHHLRYFWTVAREGGRFMAMALLVVLLSVGGRSSRMPLPTLPVMLALMPLATAFTRAVVSFWAMYAVTASCQDRVSMRYTAS